MNNALFWLIIAGFISGIVGGMGMGGGTLLIPILTIFLFFPQKVAQAINLIVFIPMAIVSLVVHIKNKLVDFRVGVPIIITGTIFSIGGSILASFVSNEILRKIFGGFLLLVGIYQAVQTIILIKRNRKSGDDKGFSLKIFIK
ncbi:MAG: sulfite exporter TauE/SafE family protein [Clostridiales bacterium]|nr:sulfite exporter TauE/SafE family protein [Clostridiales bacterium]